MANKTNIKNFTDSLEFATKISEKEDKEFERNFDKIMQSTLSYIKTLIKEKCNIENPTVEDINHLIVKDYNEMIDNSFQGANIYADCMRFLSERKLLIDKELLISLLKKTEDIDLKKIEKNEIYTDDFQKNLFFTVCLIKVNYNEFCNAFYDANKQEFSRIMDLVEKNGKDHTFVSICNEYGNMRNWDYIKINKFLNNVYYLIYGIEGRESEKDLKNKSIAAKMKEKYVKEEYLNIEDSINVKVIKDSLIESITQIFLILDKFGIIENNIDVNNERMVKLKLPGLQFKQTSNMLPDTIKNYETINAYNTKVSSLKALMSKENLKKLDIESLLQLNSFYNNRFAKVIENYSKMLFILENIEGIKTMLTNLDKEEKHMKLNVADIGVKTINTTLVKYHLLLNQVKKVYSNMEENAEYKYEKKVYINGNEENSKIQKIYEQKSFVMSLKKQWGKAFEKYFKERLPKDNNSFEEEYALVSLLHNLVYLTYEYKNYSIKAEYAYWHLAMQENLKSSMNFGIVLNSKENNGRTILLASDSSKPTNVNNASTIKLGFPNRLHVIREEFTEFWKSYTGSSLIRVYEGFEDFIVEDRYISTQILCPTDPFHIKYLEDLRKYMKKQLKVNIDNNKSFQKKKKGSKGMPNIIEKIGDKTSRINVFNENLVSHLECCFGIKESSRPVRYYDLDTGNIYIVNENGNLMLQNSIKIVNNGDVRG